MTEMSVESISLVTVRQFTETYNRSVRKAHKQFAAEERAAKSR